MKDIKDYIKVADAYGKEQSTLDEGLIDNIMKFFGIRKDDAEEVEKVVKGAGGDVSKVPSASPRDGGNPGGTTTAVDPDATDPRGDQTKAPANTQGIDGAADAAAQSDADNIDLDTTAQGDGAGQDNNPNKPLAFNGELAVNDAMNSKDIKPGDIITINNIEAEVQANDQGQKFFVHPGTLTPYDQPKPQADADTQGDGAGQDNNPNTDGGQLSAQQKDDIAGAVKSGFAGASGDEPGGAPKGDPGTNLANKLAGIKSKNLMKDYNAGGKQAMPEIKLLQTALSRVGNDPNGIDGKYGNGTYKAVQEFQTANGLTADGQAGPNTIKAIAAALGKAAPAADAGGALPAGQDQSPEDGAEPDSAQASNDAQAAQDKADADAKNDPMTAANQQQDIDTAQPNADLDRYIALLDKYQASQQQANAGGVAVENMGLRELMTLVDSKLNENLSPAEMQELQALHAKIQGYVGKPGMDDAKISNALNRYTKVIKADSAGKYDGDDLGSAPTTIANKGPDGKYDGDDLGNAPTAPKVSAERFIQKGGSATNFNVSKMKAKYPKPYVDIPQKDGTVIRGYGAPADLDLYMKADGKRTGAKIVGAKPAPVAPAADQQAGKPNANADAQQRGVQTASKEYNMKKAIKEASMNISINGDSAAEVAELASILKNAGMDTHSHSDDMLPKAKEMPTMAMEPDGHDDMVSKMRMMDEPAPDASPCGMGEDDVEEDWDNSPDEAYADTQTMTHDLSGGLNRQKKAYPKAQDGDNAMAVEASIREKLWAALNEKMTEGSRGKKKKSRGAMEDVETNEGSRGKKKKSRGAMEDVTTEGSRGKKKKSRGAMEGSRGKVSRGKKSRG